jgi:hypothetical protein
MSKPEEEMLALYSWHWRIKHQRRNKKTKDIDQLFTGLESRQKGIQDKEKGSVALSSLLNGLP